MKITVLGGTLQAGVMSALLSESGNQVFWCKKMPSDEMVADISYQDKELNDYLDKRKALGFLNEISFLNISDETEVFIFCFSPSQFQVALDTLEKLALFPSNNTRLMINGSTFGLHGTEKLKQILSEDDWVYLPDTIQEGNALQSLTQAKQLIVGCSDHRTQCKVKELLRPFFPLEQQYLFMPILDAEFTKLSISGMLATRISYINDLAVVAEKLGIDIASVRQGMAADNRIGSAYLSPGAGFGGENFSHDVLTLASTVANTGVKSQLLAQVWDINEQQKEILFRKLWNYYHGDLQGKTIAIWGASFKENTSSIQQSPIHHMLKALWAQGVTVHLHDPQALDEIEMIYGQRSDLILFQNQYEAVQNAHALCLLTAWKQYWSPDFKRLQQQMEHPLILDGRNIYDPHYVKAQGFAYIGVGR
ncbi:nucleotide sugar dehydrogenase [Acinetobacter junii]|uniref:nucleotide sugar dehydrogenase n=1 Tax=Acinetobacter junii TaxID=40215 RepID=UPI0009503FE8|nr:nucleotide sugar dehydrogenase [Acinetobacter junii]APU47195.1 UDP-glucose 6-dehydrogenase [Acinetobacter junii]